MSTTFGAVRAPLQRGLRTLNGAHVHVGRRLATQIERHVDRFQQAHHQVDSAVSARDGREREMVFERQRSHAGGRHRQQQVLRERPATGSPGRRSTHEDH
ncbi:hypothetical protein [Burkholderia ubonensis]|uniref:hypothetical protein n=1 Tax=Burkholderia ubonensis TaxID=101571 RepID=UPI002FCB10BF